MGARSRKDLLIEAGLLLSSDLPLPVVLRRVVDLAIELTGARYGALGVRAADGRIGELVTAGVSRAERRAIGREPTGAGLLGILTDGPVRLSRIADDPRSAGFPAHHPPMTTFLGAPVRARGALFGAIYLADKGRGAEFTQEDEDDLMVLATQAGAAVANATLHEEVLRRERWLEATREMALPVLSGMRTDAVLETISRLARELAAADQALVLRVTAPGDALVVAAAEGVRGDRLLARRVPMRGSLAGEAIRRGVPVTVDDARGDGRAHHPTVSLGRVGPCVVAPLVAEGRPYGALVVGAMAGSRPFSAGAVRLVEAFAAQASAVLDHHAARRHAERVAVLAERERIARTLHDGVIQSLFGVSMGLQGTAAMVPGTAVEHRLEDSVARIEGTIRELHEHVFALQPDRVADRQLDAGLRRLVAELEERSGVAAELDVEDGAARVLEASARDVLQLARDALDNVGAHAGAGRCLVALGREADGVRLTIEDDGRGFDPAAAGSGGGLDRMGARAAALHASLDVDTCPGFGTRVHLRVPAARD